MKTVKQVSDLTGISVRMLHYYDEIELLKPSAVTKSGYRLYDNEALATLQQILFFKELDIPLKEIKEIINKIFDKIKVLEHQKTLLKIKRDRLNNLIELIDNILNGEQTISFKEFDMCEYYKVLEEFKNTNKNKVIRQFGSINNFDEMIKSIKNHETNIIENAVKQFGSIKKYVNHTRKILNNDMLITISEESNKFETDYIESNHPVLKELYKKLIANLGKDPSSEEIQQIAKEITNTAKKDYKIFKMDSKGDERWYYMMRNYLQNLKWVDVTDKKYGNGSSKFIGEVFKIHLKDKKPKLEILYEKLTYDLSKDPTSKGIQKIVEEIKNVTQKNNEFYTGDIGLNYKIFLSNMADIYLSNTNKNNMKYRFIGKALKFYTENN